MAKTGFGPDGIKTRHFVLEAGEDDLDPRPVSMRCDAAGTATFVDENDVEIEYNLVQGELLAFSPKKFTAGDAVVIGYL